MLRTNAFGQWVQRRRKLLDYTQQELATLVSCAERTIRKIESGDLRPSLSTVRRLAKALQIATNDHAAVVAFAHNHSDGMPPTLAQYDDEPMSTSPPRPTATVPIPLTPLLGREIDIDSVRTLIVQDDSTVVTLTGAPGVGKTRLALALAAELADQFADGVVVVPCATVAHPDQVLATIAQYFGIQESQPDTLEAALLLALKPKHVLLVLDNFEHLLDATPQLAKLLMYAPQLKLLITSRVRLHLTNEQLYVVPPLAIPDPQKDTSWLHWTGYSAIALFINRATALDQQFVWTESNALTVVTICQHLDGLPLAIELAAARSILLPLPLLLDQLDQRLALLTTGVRDGVLHQQTLQTTLEWSYALLSPDTQQLFRCLGAFVGGFTFEGVAAVYESEGITTNKDSILSVIMNHIGVLLDHSLVQRIHTANAIPRFILLETIRVYARDQLTQRGEISMVQQRHANYYLFLAEKLAPDLTGPDQVTCLTRLDNEHDNLRAALRWSCAEDGSKELGMRLALALCLFWDLRGYLQEGDIWFTKLAYIQDAPHLLRARTMAYASYFAREVGANARAVPLAQAGIQLGHEINDALSLTCSYRILGFIAAMHFDEVHTRIYMGESMHHGQTIPYSYELARTLTIQAAFDQAQGKYAQAIGHFETTLAIYRNSGDPDGIATTLMMLGHAHFVQGHYHQAHTFYEESLIRTRDLQSRKLTAALWLRLGTLAHTQSNYTEAVSYYKRCHQLALDIGKPIEVATALVKMGQVLHYYGQTVQAANAFVDSVVIYEKLNYMWGIMYSVIGMTGVLVAWQQFIPAVRLCGSIDTLINVYKLMIEPPDRMIYEQSVSTLQAKLADDTFEDAWCDGQQRAFQDVVGEAVKLLTTLVAKQPPDPVLKPAIELTPREVEVLHLVAQGLTNTQVAEELVISPLTVSAHLRAIYRKLQVTSRGAAIRVALEQQLA